MSEEPISVNITSPMEDELAELIDEVLWNEAGPGDAERLVSIEPSPLAKALASAVMQYLEDEDEFDE